MESKMLIGRVIQAAEKYPDRPALQLPGRQYTYHELMKVAASFAGIIKIQDDNCPVIAILAERSITAYAGILGTLLAGKGYLPLNPSFPVQRNAYILDKSGANTMIVGNECVGLLSGLLKEARRSLNIIFLDDENEVNDGLKHLEDTNDGYWEDDGFDQDPTTYLLFTSGSTGLPKGVAVSNSNVTAYLDNILSLYDFSPEDRFTQTFDLTFDLSVHDLFVCWSAGACLCVPEDNSSFGLLAYLKSMKPTVWFSVPSMAVLMQKMRFLKKDAFPWLRQSFFCGEAFKKETAAAWANAAPNSSIINLYGPTEATIAVSAYNLPKEQEAVKSMNGIVSIGKLFRGHDLKLSDREGDKGQLMINGPQVVRGYFDDEELTRKNFETDANSSRIYYNTGDLVEADGDGDLYFLGRQDTEVKISGYRVNLLEIDHVINTLDTVRQVVSLYLEDRSKKFTLVSFIVRYGKKDDILEIMGHCRSQLPLYMVPEKIIFVDELPLNVNGKTDRQALAKIFNEYDG